jgi:hypothetical protein
MGHIELQGESLNSLLNPRAAQALALHAAVTVSPESVSTISQQPYFRHQAQETIRLLNRSPSENDTGANPPAA